MRDVYRDVGMQLEFSHLRIARKQHIPQYMHVNEFQVGKIVIVHREQIMIQTPAVGELAIRLSFTKSDQQIAVISRASLVATGDECTSFLSIVHLNFMSNVRVAQVLLPVLLPNHFFFG